MTNRSYYFRSRPPNSGHDFPFLVFDIQDNLHFPLTAYAKVAARGRRMQETVKNYLYAILPFFAFLDTNVWQQRAGSHWNSPPEAIRIAVTDYLSQRLQCRVDTHPHGFELVHSTRDTPSNAHAFLSALKLFYRIMIAEQHYIHANPLINPRADIYNELHDQIQDHRFPPRMPRESGIEPPRTFRRLTDSYFVFGDGEWKPQTIDDPLFPQKVLAGGRKAGWGLREEVATLMLFNTGARSFEILGQTLGDYEARNSPLEATALNKGSNGKRTKWVLYHRDTVVLLERYFNTERRQVDKHHRTMEDYRRLARQKQIDLYNVPIFLTTRQTALTTDSFREDYWKPACEAGEIDATPHQTRHWYVSTALREIYATNKTAAEIQQAKERLVAYMHWSSGLKMLEVYDHSIRAEQHAAIQQGVQERMHASLRAALDLVERDASPAPRIETVRPEQIPDVTLAFIYSLGGKTNA